MATSIIWTDEGTGEALAIEFDATISEDATHSAELTDNPVERGADFSDHLRKKNPIIKMEIEIGEIPTRQINDHNDGVQWDFRQETFQINGEDVGLTVWAKSDGDYNRPLNVYETLLGLMENATKVATVSAFKSFEDLFLISISVPRNATKAKNFKATLEFRQARIAETQIVDLPAPSQRRAQSRTNRGVQEAEGPQEETGMLLRLKASLDQQGGVGRALGGLFGG